MQLCTVVVSVSKYLTEERRYRVCTVCVCFSKYVYRRCPGGHWRACFYIISLIYLAQVGKVHESVSPLRALRDFPVVQI